MNLYIEHSHLQTEGFKFTYYIRCSALGMQTISSHERISHISGIVLLPLVLLRYCGWIEDGTPLCFHTAEAHGWPSTHQSIAGAVRCAKYPAVWW